MSSRAGLEVCPPLPGRLSGTRAPSCVPGSKAAIHSQQGSKSGGGAGPGTAVCWRDKTMWHF